MNRLAIFGYAALIAAVGGFYAWVTLRSEWGGADPPGLVIADEPPRHLVTRRMAAASEAMVERVAPPFDAPATDGQRYRLDELYRRGPVVLTFVKGGCPCSESAQRFFNRLHAAYPEALMFGVIDVEAEPARRWAGRFGVGYPLLLDPGLEIVRAYNAENSAYVVLVDGVGDRAGFAPRLIQIARKTRVSAYVGDGQNRWPAVHRLDAARLFRLALEQGSPGAKYHAVAEEGVPFRQMAELIARRVNVPVASKTTEEAPKQFRFLSYFIAVDNPVSSQQTQQRLGWQPQEPGLLADLD